MSKEWRSEWPVVYVRSDVASPVRSIDCPRSTRRYNPNVNPSLLSLSLTRLNISVYNTEVEINHEYTLLLALHAKVKFIKKWAKIKENDVKRVKDKYWKGLTQVQKEISDQNGLIRFVNIKNLIKNHIFPRSSSFVYFQTI